MALSLSPTVASAMADAITAAVDGGAGAGTLKVYTGTKPASTATGATGTLLATFTLADPAAAAASAGVSTWDFTPSISATVAANGTAGWFRIADSNGTAVLDGEVGVTGGTEKDLNFSSVAWVATGTVTITGGTLTQPTS
jgi:hypothetical protein